MQKAGLGGSAAGRWNVDRMVRKLASCLVWSIQCSTETGTTVSKGKDPDSQLSSAHTQLSLVVCTFTPSTQQAKAGRSLSSGTARTTKKPCLEEFKKKKKDSKSVCVCMYRQRTGKCQAPWSRLTLVLGTEFIPSRAVTFSLPNTVNL